MKKKNTSSKAIKYLGPKIHLKIHLISSALKSYTKGVYQ